MSKQPPQPKTPSKSKAPLLDLELTDFANIVQNADEAIMIYESRRIIFANRKAFEMAGMTPEEFIGRDIFDFIPKEDQERVSHRISARESGQENTARYEIQLLDKKGNKKDFWISSNVLTLGGKTCVLCFLSDISMQKKVASALLKSEAKYRQLIEEAHDAILLSDRNGNFYEVNPRASEIFGYTKQELLGMNIRELIFSSDMEFKPLRLDELVAGQVLTTQRELRRKDGSEFTAEVSGKMLPDGTIQGTIRDLSDRKDAEKRLRLIVEGTSKAVGENFLKDLAKSLATSLEVKYVLITEKRETNNHYAYPLVLWTDGHYDNMESYELIGTPGQQVWEKNTIVTSKDVKAEFPADPWLRKHKVTSYIGIPLSDSSHNLLGHLAIMDDKPIDDLVMAESIMRIFGARAGAELERRSLENMWRRYEFIINSSRDLMSLIDLNFQYEAVNDAYCEAHKLSREQIIGKSVSEIWGTNTYDHIIRPHLESCFKDNEFHEQAWIQPANYSKPGFFDINYYPYHNEKGKVTHAIVVTRDITDSKEAELELQYRLEFEKLITSLSTHFINLANSEIGEGIQAALKEIGEFTGVDSCFIFLNSDDSSEFEFKYIWNAEATNLINSKWKTIDFAEFPWAYRMIQRQRTVVIPNPDTLPADEILLKQTLTSSGIRSLILVPIVYGRKVRGLVGFAVTKEGKVLPANADSILRIVGEMFGNALDRKQTGERLSQLYDMQSKLFSSIAHSLKTPFSVILGNINMLERTQADPEGESQEFLAGIKSNIALANDKVSQLLKVAQLDMSPTLSTDEIIDLDVTIANIVNQGKYLFQAYNTGVVRSVIDSHLRFSGNSSAKINAETKSISDLVLTLLDNAFKHSPRKGELPDVTVTTTRKEHEAVIEIKDKGKGIPKNHLPHIFDLYYQVDTTQGGFGIGLAFCKKMSEAMGGSIVVKSTIGKGTTFTITLPVKE